MMLRIVQIRPVNSIVFVHGGRNFEVPSENFEPKVSLVAASPSCLIVGLFPEIDGPTQLHIGAAKDVDPGWAEAFADMIETPAHALIIDTVAEELVHRQEVPSEMTAIKIWLSDHRWPEHVLIGINWQQAGTAFRACAASSAIGLHADPRRDLSGDFSRPL